MNPRQRCARQESSLLYCLSSPYLNFSIQFLLRRAIIFPRLASSCLPCGVKQPAVYTIIHYNTVPKKGINWSSFFSPFPSAFLFFSFWNVRSMALAQINLAVETGNVLSYCLPSEAGGPPSYFGLGIRVRDQRMRHSTMVREAGIFQVSTVSALVFVSRPF